jgi:hypothetical protein
MVMIRLILIGICLPTEPLRCSRQSDNLPIPTPRRYRERQTAFLGIITHQVNGIGHARLNV